MKTETLRAALLASILLTAPAMLLAQTVEQQRLNEAMQLQRAMFSQDAAGNLDEAIGIYRELAGPRTSDRSLAAEAQYRLSQALLQKGDLPGASEALLQLSIQFPDQAERVSQIAGGSGRMGGAMAGVPPLGFAFQNGNLQNSNAAVSPEMFRDLERLVAQAQTLNGGAPAVENLNNMTGAQLLELRAHLTEMIALAGLPNAAYDRDFVEGGLRTVTTTVENMSWTNPQSWLRITDGGTKWNLLLPAPNRLLRLGMNRESLPAGAQITLTFTTDGRNTPQDDGSMLGRVESVVRLSDQVTVFDRAVMLQQAEAGQAAAQ